MSQPSLVKNKTMKKLFVVTLLLVSGLLSYAQPSDATVTKDIRKRFSVGKIKLGGSSTSKEKEGLIWHYFYWRHFTLTKTDASGLTGEIGSAVMYEKVGNTYTFHNYAAIETKVGGMQDPNKDELIKYFNANLSEYLGGAYGDIVVKMPVISIPSGTKFNWGSPEQVTFISKAIYSRKVSYTEVEKAEHYYEIMLFKGQNGEWNRISADEIEGQKKVISKKAYSSSEVDAMKTLQELDEEQAASAAISSLPWVEEAPVFKSDKQLFYFIHDILMSSPQPEATAHLYKVMAESNFQSGVILKQYVQDWVDKLINNLQSYQYTFCQYPKVKDEQSGMIYFYNKDKSRFVRMTAKEEMGTWKIKVIEYSPASTAEINRLKNLSGNCSEKPDLAVTEKVSYEIGDLVDVHYSNGDATAKIKKKDTSFDNRYYITFLDNGKSQWINDDQFSMSSKKQEAKKMGSVSSQNTNTEPTFNVGDHVGVKTRAGVMKGSIVETTGGKALIHWDKRGFKDMWTSLSNLVKL